MAGGKRTQARKSRDTPVTTQGALEEANSADENVFLFVPNLIGAWQNMPAGALTSGYARVVLAAISLYYMRGNPKVCTVLYCVSCLLDAFDGMAARKFDQCTKFGAVLDMVTDRCVGACARR